MGRFFYFVIYRKGFFYFQFISIFKILILKPTLRKIVLISLLFSALTPIFGQVTNIPDPNFEQALIDRGIDSDGIINGQVLTSDIDTVTTLEIVGEGISDLTGIEDFAALEILNCADNQLTQLDLSQNFMLRQLETWYNFFLTSLNITNNDKLTFLDCSQNNLTMLDLSGNPILETLFCGNPEDDIAQQNFLIDLNLSNNIVLKTVDASFNSTLTTIDISNCPQLENLYAIYCDLNFIDVCNNPNLKKLVLGVDYGFNIVSNNLESVDISNNPLLERLAVNYCNIQHLNVKNGNNPVLTQLNARNNPALYCIQVDDETAANNGEPPYSQWYIDTQTDFSEDCELQTPEFLAENVKLYPNPVKDILNLEYPINTAIKNISIYDISGRLLLQNDTNFKQLNISQLALGTFILEMETSKGRVVSKFIKE